jgi:hypothetical protein
MRYDLKTMDLNRSIVSLQVMLHSLRLLLYSLQVVLFRNVTFYGTYLNFLSKVRKKIPFAWSTVRKTWSTGPASWPTVLFY